MSLPEFCEARLSTDYADYKSTQVDQWSAVRGCVYLIHTVASVWVLGRTGLSLKSLVFINHYAAQGSSRGVREKKHQE